MTAGPRRTAWYSPAAAKGDREGRPPPGTAGPAPRPLPRGRRGRTRAALSAAPQPGPRHRTGTAGAIGRSVPGGSGRSDCSPRRLLAQRFPALPGTGDDGTGSRPRARCAASTALARELSKRLAESGVCSSRASLAKTGCVNWGSPAACGCRACTQRGAEGCLRGWRCFGACAFPAGPMSGSQAMLFWGNCATTHTPLWGTH